MENTKTNSNNYEFQNRKNCRYYYDNNICSHTRRTGWFCDMYNPSCCEYFKENIKPYKDVVKEKPINVNNDNIIHKELKVMITFEDILNLLYSIHKSMPEKSFTDIIQFIYPKMCVIENNAQTYTLLDKFVQDNNITTVESPLDVLSSLKLSLIADIDTVESNIQYCIRSGRYLEAEKEIAHHQTMTEILNNLDEVNISIPIE